MQIWPYLPYIVYVGTIFSVLFEEHNGICEYLIILIQIKFNKREIERDRGVKIYFITRNCKITRIDSTANK